MTSSWSQLDHSQSTFSPCKTSCPSNRRDNCSLTALAFSPFPTELTQHEDHSVGALSPAGDRTAKETRTSHSGLCRPDQEKEYFPAWQASPRNTHTVLHPQKVAAWPLGRKSLLPVASGLLGWETTITSSKKKCRELGGNSRAPLKEEQIYRKKYFQLTISLSACLFNAPKFSEQISFVFLAVRPD